MWRTCERHLGGLKLHCGSKFVTAKNSDGPMCKVTIVTSLDCTEVKGLDVAYPFTLCQFYIYNVQWYIIFFILLVLLLA